MRCKACNKSIDVAYRYIEEIDSYIMEDLCGTCVNKSGVKRKDSFFEDYYSTTIEECSPEVLSVLGIVYEQEDSETGD